MVSKICLEKIEEHADLRLLRVRLPEGAFERIAAAVEAIDGGKLPLTQKRQVGLQPGTILPRKFKGKEYQVEVLATGFRFEGQTYRSLSSVARAITGTNWNGKAFFGLRKAGGRRPETGGGL